MKTSLIKNGEELKQLLVSLEQMSRLLPAKRRILDCSSLPLLQFLGIRQNFNES